jgi:hypothetical protein
MKNMVVDAGTLEDGGLESGSILPNSVVQDMSKIVSFMREDDDHVVFKRFEKINLYNLLALQHRLTVLDKEIALYEGTDYDGTDRLARLVPKMELLVKDYSTI